MTVDEANRGTAGIRQWAGLAVLTLAVLMVTFDMFVLLLALPGLSADLRPSAVEQLWILDVYGFVVAGFLVTTGMLGDRIGRRKLLMTGAACFATASLASAFATSPAMLVALRALLGVAGATLAPSTLALISTMFRDARQRGIAVGVWAAGFTVGAMLGPVVGGVLLAHFWWGSVFLLGVPVMVLLLVLCPLLVPEYKNPDAGRPDLASAVLSLGAMVAVTYALKQIARYGWHPLPVLVGVAGVGLGVLFLRRQRHLADPVVDTALFRDRSFSVMLSGLLLFGVVGAASMVFITQFLQSVSGLSPLRAALCMVPGMVAGVIGTTVAPVLGRWIRPSLLIGWGVLGVAAGYAMFLRLDEHSSPVVLIIGFVVIGLCQGPLLALGVNMVVGTAPVEKAGSSSSMAQIANETGASLGIAVLGSAGAAVYASRLTSALPPGVPDRVTAAAEESLARAVAVAPDLPPRQAGELLAVARAAFADGMNVFAAISVAVLVVVAVLVMTLLGHVPPTGREETAPDVATEDLTAG